MRQPSLQFDLSTPGELLIEIASRFDEAGMTLARLPGGMWTADMIAAVGDDDGPLESEIEQRKPTPREIDRMDETLSWVAVLPAAPDPLRLLIQKRLVRSARTGRHRYSWRKLGRVLGVSHHTARDWHARALETIARKICVPHVSTSHASHFAPSISLH